MANDCLGASPIRGRQQVTETPLACDQSAGSDAGIFSSVIPSSRLNSAARFIRKPLQMSGDEQLLRYQLFIGHLLERRCSRGMDVPLRSNPAGSVANAFAT